MAKVKPEVEPEVKSGESKSKVVRVKVEGVYPILMNPMTEATLDSLITGNRLPPTKDLAFEEVASRKIYREGGEPDGAIGIPVENLCSCLVRAGREVKNGKKQISTAESTTLFSFLSIRGEFLPFTNDLTRHGDGKGWVVDKRRGCLHDKGKSTAVGILRPKFPVWAFEFVMDLDLTEIDEGVVRKLVEVAGKKVGLGDFRPTCKGPFGRFQVVSWEEAKKEVPAAA
ncbi:MAG: hypothetical protein WC518_04360 [Patescibacteria group bacterium]